MHFWLLNLCHLVSSFFLLSSTNAVESFKIPAPGGYQFLDCHVGETVSLDCESKCGDLYWFVNGERVRPRIGELENTKYSTRTGCVNEDNTCGIHSFIDCSATYEDRRILRSTLNITPTEEHQFLIECEADLFGVEIRKSVLLIAKSTLSFDTGSNIY